MAEEVKIPFVGDFSEMAKGLTELRDLTVQLRDATQANSKAIQSDAQKNVAATESVNKALEETLAVTSALNKEGLGDFSKGVKDAEKSLDSAAKSAEEMGASLSSAGDEGGDAFRVMVDAARKANAEAKEIAKTEGVIIKEIDKHKAAQVDLLAELKAITREEAAIFKESIAITDSFEEQAKPVASLRTQFKLAKEELDSLIEASDGKITPELVQAARRAGELQDRIGDLNDIVKVFNPDAKFQAFANVLGNVASGFQAGTAALGLFGQESEDVNRALLKIQQTVAFVQGLQGLFGGLADNLKNIRTLIVATTTAQRAGTAATTADATAKGAQAVATTASTAATFSLSTAIRGLTASLLASPLLPVVAALAAAAYAFSVLSEETRDYAKEVDDLNKKLDDLTAKRLDQIDNKLRLQNIQAEREALQAGETDAARRRKSEIDFQNKRAALVAKQLEFELNIFQTLAALKGLEGENSDEAIAARERLLTNLNEYRKQYSTYTNDIIGLTEEQTNETIKETNRVRDDAKKKAEERVRIAQDLNKKLIDLNKQLSTAVAATELESADPLEKAALEKKAADIRIDALEKEIRETTRLRTGQATLTKEQEDQLTTLRLASVEAYWKKRQEIEQSNAEKLFAQAEKNVALEQRLAIAQVEQRQRGAESEEEFERQKQAAILAIKIEAAKKGLELLATNTTEEGTVLRAELQALIVALQSELAGLAPKADKKEFSIYRLLGLDPTPEEKRAIEQSINSAVTAVQQAIAAQEAQVQAQIAATDRIIADRERRSEDLQSRLANEIALSQAGFASNVDLIRQQIAIEDAAAEAEKVRRAQLVADQQRLAKQQLAIDSVVQASALATAAAKVFSAEAPKGILGILGAIGVLASMIAAFASIKARAKAISAEQFEDGGHVGGRRHSQGGTLIEAERGEYVTRRGATAKWGPVLEGINEGAWTRQRQAALVELLDSANVRLSPDMTDSFVLQKETLVGQNVTLKSDNARLEKKVTALTEEVRGMRRDGSTKVAKEGSYTVTRKPGRTTRRKA